MRVAAQVAAHKTSKPWLFCPAPRCLWRTGSIAENSAERPAPHCPRHRVDPDCEDPMREGGCSYPDCPCTAA